MSVRAHMEHWTDAAIEDTTARLLIERTRAGLGIQLAGLAILWATDAIVHGDVVMPLTVITVLQASFVGLGFLMLARTTRRRA